jgi:hypothetical protein
MNLLGHKRILELLAIISSFENPCTSEDFAKLAFPDSPAWNSKPKRRRRGWKPGGRMISAASGVLGQLGALYLVKRTPDGERYFLTPSGIDYLHRGGARSQRREEVPKEMPPQTPTMQTPYPPVEAYGPWPPGWKTLPDGRVLWWSGTRYLVPYPSGWVPA